MAYVIRQTEPGLYTVGHSDGGVWEPYADYGDQDEATAWCAHLNGGPHPEEPPPFPGPITGNWLPQPREYVHEDVPPSDYEIRHAALDAAVHFRIGGDDENGAAVLRLAREFEAYLRGDGPAATPDPESIRRAHATVTGES